MRPRKFYVGFPPALVKVRRNGIEYGIGTIPLGGYVKIPGMHRPAPSDLDVHLGRALHEAPELAGPVERSSGARRGGDGQPPRPSCPSSRPRSSAPSCRRRPTKGAERVVGRPARRARRRRLLAPAHLEEGRRHLRRARRPTSSSPSSCSPPSTGRRARRDDADGRHGARRTRPRRRRACAPATRSSRSTRTPVAPDRISETIRASEGEPLRLDRACATGSV